MRYVLCVLLGVLLGASATAVAASALAGPKIAGDSGYLFGYDVRVNREKVCRDPWVWINPGGATGGTIECK